MRIEAACPDTLQTPPSRSPVGIFADAVESESKSDLWNQVKAAAASASDDRSLPAILSDDTTNFLSLASTDAKERLALGIPDPTPTISTPLNPVFDTFLSPKANGNSVPVRKPSLRSDAPPIPQGLGRILKCRVWRDGDLAKFRLDSCSMRLNTAIRWVFITGT